MKHAEEKTVVPANQGFYVVLPMRDEAGAVVDTYYEPIVAWAVDPDGVVQPITYVGSASDLFSKGECDVLCPNGTVLSENNIWGSLDEWLSCQKQPQPHVNT
ncbi:MAG: hypothetical protein ACYCS8_04860 [Acidithiobacillus sp.]